jgi:hypothetical protein
MVAGFPRSTDMNLSLKARQLIPFGFALCALLMWAQAHAAQEITLDVTLKDGTEVVSTAQATTQVGQEVEVKVGSRYTLKITPTLPVANAISYQVRITDAAASPGAFAEAISTAVRIGDVAKLFEGRKGSQEIEINAKLK